MLQFSMLGFPVVIQWFFWLVMALLCGAFNAMTREAWIDVALRVIVAAVSILVHELGHALAARKFGYHSTIVLHGFGGLTIIPHAQFTRGQSIWVSASGPLAGFLLAGISFILAYLLHFGHIVTEYEGVRTMVSFSLFINVAWTLMNLLPVLPMDGGQILRELLGPGKLRVACVIGGVVAVIVAFWAISEGYIFMAAMFGYFAWINFSNGSAEGGVMKN
jgi:stage IV sporulation protein FB